MTLMIYALWLVGNVFGFVALGSTAMTARFVGAGDREMANRVMNQSITSGLVWSMLLMAFALPLAGYFPLVMGLEGTAAAAAHRYLMIELCVLPAVMVERVAVACLRGAGDTVSGLVTMAIVNVVNMVVSYALARGLGPLPELGWTGIALGTAIGHVLRRSDSVDAAGRAAGPGFICDLRAMSPDFDLIRRILRIGVPGGIDVMLVSICHLIYLRIVLSLGDVAAAAHGVAIQVEALGYMPGGAFQISAATMAGQYLGARDLVRARRSVIMACAVASGDHGGRGHLFLRRRHAAGIVLSRRAIERGRAARRPTAANRGLRHVAAGHHDGLDRCTARCGRHPLAARAESARHRAAAGAAGVLSGPRRRNDSAIGRHSARRRPGRGRRVVRCGDRHRRPLPADDRPLPPRRVATH